MATKTKDDEALEIQAPDPSDRDERVDEYAWIMFRDHMGYKNPLPPLLVETYNNVKRMRDMLGSGVMSPEGFSIVNEMYRMKVFFEDAGMLAFAKNMTMPDKIEKEIRKMALLKLK